MSEQRELIINGDSESGFNIEDMTADGISTFCEILTTYPDGDRITRR